MYQLTSKYDISFETNQKLLQGQAYKREGNYKKANEIYNTILSAEGPSGILYIAMAKNLACQKKYNEAIELFELANRACIIEHGVEDFNSKYHIQQLKNRNLMSKEEFKRYISTIAGNPYYEFPNE